MLSSRLLADALRAAVLLGLALGAMPLLRGASSNTRRILLAVALTGALVMPVLSAALPTWHFGSSIAASIATAEPGAIAVDRAMPASAIDAPSATLDAASVNAPRAAVSSSIAIESIALGLWAIGAFVVMARLVMGFVKAGRIVRRSVAAPDWSESIDRAYGETGLRANVRRTNDLDAPAVTGIFRPVILVTYASMSWTRERRRVVLLHELAHIGQRDCLVQLVAQIACALHWYSPLAWMAIRRLRLERELAADDAVLLAGAKASSYAEDLFTLATSGAEPAPSGVLGMAQRSELASRVDALLDVNRSRRPLGRFRKSLLAVSGAAAVLGTACASPLSAPVDSDAHATTESAAARNAASAATTIDPVLQRIAEEELDRAVAEWKPNAGTVLVVNPKTGAILANAGRVHGEVADVAIRKAYVTGSTMKAVTLAAAFEEGVVTETDRFDCEHGSWKYAGETVTDAGQYDVLTVPEMLAVSSNVGFVKLFGRLGGDRLHRYFRAFNFGSAPAIDGANAGTVPDRIEDGTMAGALSAIGESVTASPLQVALAYVAIANGGMYLSPTLTRGTEPNRVRVLREDTAHRVVSMLEESVNGERATGKLARIEGPRVAGKTGTAALNLRDEAKGVYSSFVGFAPSTSPRFVILVGLEQPRDGESGGKVAAPVFARVLTRALAARE